jgi:hypothetical protein
VGLPIGLGLLRGSAAAAVLKLPTAFNAVNEAVVQAMPALTPEQQRLAVQLIGSGGISPDAFQYSG